MAFSEHPDLPSESVTTDITEATTITPPPIELIDQAKRHFALKEYESSAEKLAEALEKLGQSHPEDAPLLAPILHLYGRSLLEHAIVTSGALGGGGNKQAPLPSKLAKQEQRAANQIAQKLGLSQADEGSSSSKPADPRFSFSGDAEDSDSEGEQEQQAGGGEEDEDGDEDDLGVAFSVLDLARVIYERALGLKLVDGSDSESTSPKEIETLDGTKWGELKLKTELAEVMNDLGDVGLESENFQQASADYSASLSLLSPLLHPHSRRLADAHLRLGLALEFHPEVSEREGAIRHVKAASETLGLRLSALEARKRVIESNGELADSALASAVELREQKATSAEGESKEGGKGKGKAVEIEQRIEKDDVLEMPIEKVEKEIKDVKEMKEELDNKLEEYESPEGAAKLNAEGASETIGSSKAALEKAIAEAFSGAASSESIFPGSGSASSASGPVNDLSGMVKRKKAPAVAAACDETEAGVANGKRKAEEGEKESEGKKAKVGGDEA
ncbi:hypothetical protein IE53DRAFT_387640 [Violaceomyces palustris]|uniref:Uncharacterized protein n=1 Tax=Violaceomyces palustris TaxID=1673888 RepID=A0ACD0NWC8_9BASI|nr:hypothetical protein IE53DRAFT_387640 [Violaceomyces palustris]